MRCSLFKKNLYRNQTQPRSQNAHAISISKRSPGNEVTLNRLTLTLARSYGLKENTKLRCAGDCLGWIQKEESVVKIFNDNVNETQQTALFPH